VQGEEGLVGRIFVDVMHHRWDRMKRVWKQLCEGNINIERPIMLRCTRVLGRETVVRLKTKHAYIWMAFAHNASGNVERVVQKRMVGPKNLIEEDKVPPLQTINASEEDGRNLRNLPRFLLPYFATC